jgi:hypothetical protein
MQVERTRFIRVKSEHVVQSRGAVPLASPLTDPSR